MFCALLNLSACLFCMLSNLDLLICSHLSLSSSGILDSYPPLNDPKLSVAKIYCLVHNPFELDVDQVKDNEKVYLNIKMNATVYIVKQQWTNNTVC